MELNRNKIVLIINLLIVFFNNINYNGYYAESSIGRPIPIDILGPLLILFNYLYLRVERISLTFVSKKTNFQIVFFFIMLLFITLLRGNFFNSIRNLIAIYTTYFVLILVARISSKIEIKTYLNLLVDFIVFIVLPVNILIQFFIVGGFAFFPDRVSFDFLRFGGGLYHAHNGMTLGFAFLLQVFLLKNYNNNHLYFIYIKLLVLLVFIILTDCRSVWGAIIVCVVIINTTSFKSSMLIKYLSGFFIFVLILFMVSNYMSSVGTGAKTTEDFEYRTEIWNISLDGIKESPLIGYGVDGFFPQSIKAKTFNENLNDTHSSILALLLQFGIIVSSIFFYIYYTTGRFFYKYTKKKYKGLIFILVFWIFAPFFWGNIYNGTTSFIQWFFPFSVFSILLHDDIFSKKNIVNNLK